MTPRGLRGLAPCAAEVDDVDLAGLLPRLSAADQPSLLESSAGPADVSRWSILAWGPRFVVSGGAEVLEVIDAVSAAAPPAPCQSAPQSELPFMGGLIGYLSYEARRWFEDVPAHARRDVALPDAEFAFYDVAVVRDNAAGRTFVVSAGPDIDAPLARYAELLARPPRADLSATVDPAAVEWNVTPAAYCAAVEQARERIFAGDVYEVCLSQRFFVGAAGSPAAAYLALRAESPSPFAAFQWLGRRAVISSSPERFLLIDDGVAETRPIKGTVRRADTAAANAAQVAALQADPKQQAEHLMIVDLARNDLSRVCRPSTVRVRELARAEVYSHVNHLVSVVEGGLVDGTPVSAVLAALFPGGSITGAPKIRAMEVIDELEPLARGVYCGSMGYVSVHGRVDLNIAIRTLLWADGRLYGNAGGAVVAESDPQAEWQETQDKASGMLAALARLTPAAAPLRPRQGVTTVTWPT